MGGFVAKADDVANCENYLDYYNNLALNYDGSAFNPVTDEYLGVIRFKSNAVSTNLEIPYGKTFGGNNQNPLPFTGNGFAGGADANYALPEYTFSKEVNNGYYEVIDGAELYKVTKEGDEILLAIYDANIDNPLNKATGKGKFVRLEDMS